MTTPDPVHLRARIESSPLYNHDLAPATPQQRHWGTYNFAALWISMSVNILTYMLAASLIQGGMNWKQAVATIFIGNVIVLAPMLLNSHPGAKYGIPFPVLARASFGVLGANVAAVIRALVACGWFGIQAWIGGEAISTLLATLVPSWKNFPYGAAVCFFIFWLINLAVVLKGIEYIRMLQGISAPVLLGVGLLLLGWAYKTAGGFGPMLVGSFAIYNLSRIPQIPDSSIEWDGRVLGHGFAEHSRLHALCPKSAGTNHWASARFAHHDDLVCVCGNRRHVGNGCDLRHGDLGSRSTAEPVPFSRGSRDFAGCDSLSDFECQHRS